MGHANGAELPRLVTFAQGEGWSAGVEIDGSIVDLTDSGVPGATGVREILAAGAAEQAVETARDLLARGAQAIPSETVRRGPAVVDPQKVICVGANYRAHLDESDFAAPPFPEVFAKYPNALIGSGTPIPLEHSEQIDFEGELALVIGTRCKEVPREEALNVIGGYSVVNDLSARDVQLRVSQWVVGKTFDGFAPLGPGLVPATYVSDPHSLRITTRLNGETMQDSDTSHLIFDIADIVSYLSTYMTLLPGDVICTGTPGGVGLYRDPPRFLREGDRIEVEVEGLGVLSNPVGADSR